MSLKPTKNRKTTFNKLPTATKQRGSSLVIAVFIIVVFAILSLSITQTISSSTDQNVNEILGTRSLLAADTATELVLTQIFPLNNAPYSCIAKQQLYFATAGLENCNAVVSCQEVSIGNNDYFEIVSTGVCKAALVGNSGAPASADEICSALETCVSRTLEVEARK